MHGARFRAPAASTLDQRAEAHSTLIAHISARSTARRTNTAVEERVADQLAGPRSRQHDGEAHHRHGPRYRCVAFPRCVMSTATQHEAGTSPEGQTVLTVTARSPPTGMNCVVQTTPWPSSRRAIGPTSRFWASRRSSATCPPTWPPITPSSCEIWHRRATEKVRSPCNSSQQHPLDAGSPIHSEACVQPAPSRCFEGRKRALPARRSTE